VQNKTMVIKNVYDCNLECWYCSTGSRTGFLSTDQVLKHWKERKPKQTLLIGGEPMILGPSYYLELLEKGMNFSIQSNLTLYTEEWDEVLLHPNFTGLSVSGDKFPTLSAFIEKYLILVDRTGRTPGVLILFDDVTYEEALYKGRLWMELGAEYCFDVKFNYIMPSGSCLGLVGKVLPISTVFKVYTELAILWDKKGRKIDIQPIVNLMRYIQKQESNTCPFCVNCHASESIYNVEVNEKVYPCPVLGDLEKTREEIMVDVPAECMVCEHAELCRGCYMRSWAVEKEKDENYCKEAKVFFRTLKRLAEKVPNVIEESNTAVR